MSRLWNDIIESIKGTEQDFTRGKIGRAILLLSIPMVLEMVMESVFAVADIFFVSKLGADAVATVGITESLMTIIYAIGMGLSMATTGMIARRIGEKKSEEASETAVQALFLAIISSLIIAIPGFIFSSGILKMMGGSQWVIIQGKNYTGIMLGANLVVMLLFINNAIFRSAGDAAISMRVLWIANILNIILDPCFIFGLGPFPKMGVTGAALATTIGRGVGVLYQFYLLTKGKGRIRIYRNIIQFKPKIMFRLLNLSAGGIGQFIISTSSWVGLYRIMAAFGSEVLAGYTIAIRIVIFSLLPSWGMSNAAATLVGQNLGARQPSRAEKSVWITGFINTGFLLIVAFIFLSIPEKLVAFFTTDEAIVIVAVDCLRIISLGYIFFSFGMVMSQAFNGAGDTNTPTVLNFICFWLIEIPLAWILSHTMGLNERGIFLAIVISESLLGVLGIILFRRGKWKLKEV
jgi:putative MATE family efflux protein